MPMHGMAHHAWHAMGIAWHDMGIAWHDMGMTGKDRAEKDRAIQDTA